MPDYKFQFVIVDTEFRPGIPKDEIEVEPVIDKDQDSPSYNKEKPFHFKVYSSFPELLNRQDKLEAISQYVSNDLTILF